jgi:hypothetical protein
MDMTGGGAVGNHRHRQRGRVGGVIHDLDVDHGGQAAQALRTNTQRVHRSRTVSTQLLQPVAAGRGLSVHAMSTGSIKRFLGQQHRLFGRAADANAQHAGRTPAGAHGRHRLHHPVEDAVGRG